MSNEEKEIKLMVLRAQSSTDRDEKRNLIERLLEKLKPFRFALGKRFAGKGVDFDDIVQQIDLKLIEAIYDYDQTKDSSALRHVTARARNGVWNFYRKEMNYFDENKKLLSLDSVYDPDNNTGRYEGLKEILEDEKWDEEEVLTRMILEEELAKLTPHQQKVLMLYFIEDRTQYDIAEELSITQANVSRAKTRAITQIRQSLMPLDGSSETQRTDD